MFIRLKPFQPIQYIYRPVSIVIPARNEERNIGRCLESLHELVEEIIVLDSFSTYKTKEICISFKNLKAGFLPFTFKENKEVQSGVTTEILTAYLEELATLLAEIFNPEIPFKEKIV